MKGRKGFCFGRLGDAEYPKPGREEIREGRRKDSDKMGLNGSEDILIDMFWRLILVSGLRVWLGLQVKTLLVGLP